MKRALILIFILFPLAGFSQSRPNGQKGNNAIRTEPEKRPRNIILMIGDGMGLTQITAGMFTNGNHLNLEQFPITGLQKAYSGNDLITDSAAGATAFASGIKTYNGAIGVGMDTLPVKTILEELKADGYATGLVTTSSLTHATPAAFVAHVKSRNLTEEVAAFFLKTRVDLLIGGGKNNFDRRSSDERNLLQELRDQGYAVFDYLQKPIHDIPIDFDRELAYFTADQEPGTRQKGRDYLPQGSKLAPVFLKKRSDKGFFLMIEGAQIDWGGHDNDSGYLVSEMIDFDQAIGEVLAFAKADGETLVIVTADHETGGFSINQGSRMDSLVTAFTTDKHTGVLIPVFAFGPGSKLFGGIYENTAIFNKMRQALGLEEVK